MALFKILKGEGNLPDIKHEGWAYVKKIGSDEANFYVDYDDKTRVQIGKNGIFYIAGTGTTAGKWIGTHSGIESYYTGLAILYKIPITGASTTTLNINDLGEKTCYVLNNSKLTTHYPVNGLVLLTYDASLNSNAGGWKAHSYYDSNTYTTAYCTTGAGTASKTASQTGYVLKAGNCTILTLRYANTFAGALTLNINSTGEKPIYINGEASSSSNYTLPAGSYLTYYDGSNYLLYTDNTIPANITGNAETANKLTDAKKFTFTGDISGSGTFDGSQDVEIKLEVADNSQIATTTFVTDAISESFAANDAMIFKGTIGTGGTVTALPDTHNIGWTYRVITPDTYAGKKCEIGDLIICITDGTVASDSDWTVAQTNIDGAIIRDVTEEVGSQYQPIYVNKSGIVRPTVYTLKTDVPENAVFTDTKVTQTVTTSNTNYPLLLAPSGQTATTTTTSYFDSGVTLNPSTNTIAANISGNAESTSSLKFTPLASDTDLNDVTTPGLYSIASASTAQAIANNPLSSTSTGIFIKVYLIGWVIYQEVTGVRLGGIWKRRCDNGNWSPWVSTDNAASAIKLQNSRTIDGVSFNGTAAITHYGTCSTDAAITAKIVSLTGFNLVTGARIAVKFDKTNTASNPTLNVNNKGAKAIMYRGSAISASTLEANRVYEFVYDGTDWELIGDIDTNYYPTTWTWADGTTAGPTATLSGNGMSDINIAAIPTASTTISGIVTTEAQSFAGRKTFADLVIPTSAPSNPVAGSIWITT